MVKFQSVVSTFIDDLAKQKSNSSCNKPRITLKIKEKQIYQTFTTEELLNFIMSTPKLKENIIKVTEFSDTVLHIKYSGNIVIRIIRFNTYYSIYRENGPYQAYEHSTEGFVKAMNDLLNYKESDHK